MNVSFNTINNTKFAYKKNMTFGNAEEKTTPKSAIEVHPLPKIFTNNKKSLGITGLILSSFIGGGLVSKASCSNSNPPGAVATALPVKIDARPSLPAAQSQPALSLNKPVVQNPNSTPTFQIIPPEEEPTVKPVVLNDLSSKEKTEAKAVNYVSAMTKPGDRITVTISPDGNVSANPRNNKDRLNSAINTPSSKLKEENALAAQAIINTCSVKGEETKVNMHLIKKGGEQGRKSYKAGELFASCSKNGWNHAKDAVIVPVKTVLKECAEASNANNCIKNTVKEAAVKFEKLVRSK
jgi:hypothetical protein